MDSRPDRCEEPLDDRWVLENFHKVNSLIRREDYTELLKLASEKRSVNLSGDHLLSVVITSENTTLALRLIHDLPKEILSGANSHGDTALHVAVTVGDRLAAKALLNKDVYLVGICNKKQETPLHKAALYGQRDMFWCLLKEWPGEDRNLLSNMRGEHGATMLHCAIKGNAPVLALEIAKEFPDLITSRNDDAVTPLQLMVTIPEAFRSQLVLGPLEDFLYRCIPSESDDYAHRKYNGDEEKAQANSIEPSTPSSKSLRSKFPSQYDILSDLFGLMMYFPASSRIQELEKKKKIHGQVMELVTHLALHPGYFEFFIKGRTAEDYSSRRFNSTDPFHDLSSSNNEPSEELSRFGYCILKILSHEHDEEKPAATASPLFPPSSTEEMEAMAAVTAAEAAEAATAAKAVLKEMIRRGRKLFKSATVEESFRRWDEPPLTLGARMGLDEYVIGIIEAYPLSAQLRDTEGRSVLQVAIKYGRSKIVEFIKEKFQEKNPILPSWLLTSIDPKTGNTLLHIASKKVIDEDEDDAFKLQKELKLFELIKEMVPQDLVNNRNRMDKTARETFTENHRGMVSRCKNKLIETGRTCSGMVAAVVFASSFSIPGEKYSKELAFKIFSRAYVIGVSCAATSLVIFLSLMTSPYKEQQFRRAIPAKCFFANFSFAMAMAALLLSFTCNAFLQLYNTSTETNQAVEIGLELTVFPIATFLVLLCRGSTLDILSFRGLRD